MNAPLPQYDLLLKGGRVVDPSQEIDSKLDVTSVTKIWDGVRFYKERSGSVNNAYPGKNKNYRINSTEPCSVFAIWLSIW